MFSFTNSDTLELLARKGLETRAREDGKVFPVDGNGPAVAEAFGSLLDDFAVRVQFSSRVKKVFHRDGQFELLFDTHGTLCSKHLVLATGGVSWPQTGTTGDGLRIARSLGHTLAASSPALAPLYLVRPPSPALAGISLRSVGLRFPLCPERPLAGGMYSLPIKAQRSGSTFPFARCGTASVT